MVSRSARFPLPSRSIPRPYVDHRGYEHEISFGAQDDTWAECWRERTRIPLGNYEKRRTKLQDWPADATLHPGDPLNRDPHVTDEQLAEFIRLRVEDMIKNVGRLRWSTLDL